MWAPASAAWTRAGNKRRGPHTLLAGQEEGGIRVNDPNSPQNSEKLWDWATLEPQIRNLWAFPAAP